MSTSFAPIACMLAAALLAGCTTPRIENGSVGRPKTVVIQDFPDPQPVATIEVVTANWPQMYYSGRFDRFYVIDDAPPTPSPAGATLATGVTAGAISGAQMARNNNGNVYHGAVAGGVVGGIVGGIIAAGAESTQKKAEEFPALFRQATPDIDLHADLLKGIKSALEAKGMQVRIADDTRNMPPRLYWPAKPPRGENLVTGTLEEHPPVDADVLVQLAPLAIYASPGPLNNYNSKVGVAVAMYNGRTREFIGWQALYTKENELWYARYDSLVADIAKAAPAQAHALMSLVPQVANVICGEQQ